MTTTQISDPLQKLMLLQVTGSQSHTPHFIPGNILT